MFYRKLLGDLENWNKSENRKPMIIRGARQVGKTTLVNEFGKQFKQYIYINLEKQKDKTYFEENLSVQEISERLFLDRKKQLSLLSETLLFIDEIQEVPSAINLLRYFKEELPELAVIAAGSMLETLLGKNISFPVGRVEYRILRPVSFEEFLEATDETMALEQLRTIPLNDYAYPTLLELFHRYALLGGMPEIINNYAKNRDVTALEPIYQSLINSYLEDAEKYAKSPSQLQLIRFTINQVMFQAGKRITFQGFGNSNYKSREISETLRTLQKTHLIHLIYPTVGFEIPLINDYKKSPKLQFLDIGLINYSVGLQNSILSTKDLNTVYKGLMIEQLIGQEILSYQTQPLDKLNFWVREKNSSQAELDYVYPYKGKLVPIEVKSGAEGKIKSLMLFMETAPINFAFRFYAGKISVKSIITQTGKKFYLLNLPYFLGTQMEQYINWFEKNLPQDEIESIAFNEPRIKYKKTEKTNTLDSLNSKHLSILEFCSLKPRKGKEILEDFLKISYQSYNKKQYLKPLLILDLLEWTDQNNIKSKKQEYQLTEKGKEFLKKTAGLKDKRSLN